MSIRPNENGAFLKISMFFSVVRQASTLRETLQKKLGKFHGTGKIDTKHFAIDSIKVRPKAVLSVRKQLT